MLAYVILICSSVLCNIFVINGSFVFDDIEAVVNNRDVNSDVNLSELFKHDFWGAKLSHKSSHKSYRPLAIIAFRFLKFIANGNLDPCIFRTANIIVHTIVVLLFYRTLQIVLSKFGVRKSENEAISFNSALVFAVHPVHSENVSWFIFNFSQIDFLSLDLRSCWFSWSVISDIFLNCITKTR